MDYGYLVRALVALLLAAFMWSLARGARDRPHRRRGLELAAGALIAFAAFNGALAADVAIGPLQIAVAVVGLLLFAGAALFLILSYYTGEMRDQRDRIAEAAREYRERRAKDDR
jgi:peptidoglycan/LPS O-acetylase OafA/YrhL